MNLFLELIIIGIIMLIFDSIYLKLLSSFFTKQIEKVQNTPLKINYVGLLLCYLFLILGLYYFIIKDKKPVLEAFLLGVFVYSVYELTNLATFTNWKYNIVILDTLWGGVLFSMTTYLVYKLV